MTPPVAPVRVIDSEFHRMGAGLHPKFLAVAPAPWTQASRRLVQRCPRRRALDQPTTSRRERGTSPVRRARIDRAGGAETIDALTTHLGGPGQAPCERFPPAMSCKITLADLRWLDKPASDRLWRPRGMATSSWSRPTMVRFSESERLHHGWVGELAFCQRRIGST